MIHRFSDVEDRFPDIPVLGIDNSPLQTHTIWQIGNAAVPYRMGQTAVSSVTPVFGRLGDPQREPTTGDTVVYSRFSISGTITREVRIVDWADANDTQLYTETDVGAGGESLEPTWKPDGTKIMFRAEGGSSKLNLIKHMNPDGSGVATLYTGSDTVSQPLYSYDGTKIAWVETVSGQQTLVRVANADGSSPSTVFNAGSGVVGTSVAWKHGSLTLAFRAQASIATTSDETWRVVNHDGTGSATWLTVSRASGYGPGEGDPALIMYSWLENDTDLVATVRQLADPDPDARLTLIDSGGSNLVSPARYTPTNAGSPDMRPAAITGRLEGVERLYFPAAFAATGVVSVKTDGTGYRVDWDGSGTPGGSSFHGFRGDTVDV